MQSFFFVLGCHLTYVVLVCCVLGTQLPHQRHVSVYHGKGTSLLLGFVLGLLPLLCMIYSPVHHFGGDAVLDIQTLPVVHGLWSDWQKREFVLYRNGKPICVGNSSHHSLLLSREPGRTRLHLGG